MTDNVVSLAQARLERSPHWTGPCRCFGCRHEWVGSAPIGTHIVECPECHMMKGHMVYLFGAAEGVTCDCGSEAVSAYYRGDVFHVRCIACGTDLTEAFCG